MLIIIYPYLKRSFQSKSVEFFFKNARSIETAETGDPNDTAECETASATDISELREIKYNGINLRELTIPYEPSKYGRKIAEIIFGKNQDSELIHSMIEPEGSNTNRPPVDSQKQADFKELILWAYSKRGPVKAQYAYQLARNSANQRGRELKISLKSPASEATINKESSSSHSPYVD